MGHLSYRNSPTIGATSLNMVSPAPSGMPICKTMFKSFSSKEHLLVYIKGRKHKNF